MIMKAYDIVTGAEGALPAGWAGPQGPAIDPQLWPRSLRTGQPMHHRFTLWLPREYRRRGDDRVAVSVFQWHDAFYWRGPAAPAGPAHPLLHLADDGVDQVFALLWLTEAEYAAAPTERPAVVGPPTDGEEDFDGKPERHSPLGPLWLRERDDPNAGLAPVDFPAADEAYRDIEDRFDRFGTEHLGGTSMDANGTRDGLSPWYFEVYRLGGFNHGGDADLAFDLDAAHMLGDLSSHVRYASGVH